MFTCFKRRKTPNKTPEVEGVKRDSKDQIKNYTPESIEFELAHLFQTCKIGLLGKQKESHILWYKKKLLEGKERYHAASKRILSSEKIYVPWEVIAVLHAMEAGFSFDRQILNGQNWNKKTTIVPKGYGPWGSWEDSIVTAFNIRETPENWNLGNTLYFCERFNGLGYRKKGKRSPYLWSYSNYQQKGKYIKDHIYDENAVSLQVGITILLKSLNYSGYCKDGKKLGA